MKASWEKIEKNHGVLEIEVGVEKVTEALDKAFKKVVAKVNVPGFRKGRVPRQIFEAKFGIESLYQDAIDIILPEAYREALVQTGIEPIDRPEVTDIEDFAKGQPFKFKAKVLVKPEVQLGSYKGIEVPERHASASDEEVQTELTRMQERHAELAVLEEGTAEKGDTAVIDFDGYLDDEPFDGGKGEKHALELGSNSFIPGFEEQVIGMVKDEDKDIKVTFPENYQAEHLAAKEVLFKVRLHDIKRKILPALDDEFAKDVSEFDTLEEYKQDISQKITAKKEQENKFYIETTVIEKASEVANLDIPQLMINSELELMLQEFDNRLKKQGMALDQYYQFSGQNEAALREQMQGDAEKRVRNNLVLEAIAKEENVLVTDEEINEELEKMAIIYKKPADELLAILSANGNIIDLKYDLLTRKTVKFLVEHSKKVADSEVA